MPIYTKFGDKGKTSLLGGEVVPKSDMHVEAYGSVDELNAVLGLALSFCDMDEVRSALAGVQDDLFVIGADLASKGGRHKSLRPARMIRLEAEIDRLEAALPPLKHFILPGGSKTASLLHLARTICRRAERRVVELSEREKVNPDNIIYLNRLGDLLFMLARSVNYRKKVQETVWRGGR
jgi:cob(I)alamin adenosyltransferase